MPRSCGIRLGPRHWELVVLEGSVKNPKVRTQLSGEIPLDEDPLAAAGDVLRRELKAHKIPSDNVALAIDGGLAAYRSVTLPFDDRGKTEQVIKFEVESELPQWNIDDVLVDFHVLNATGMQSHVLVTAVPKVDVRERIDVLEDIGYEPFQVELDGTALVNAAQFAGVLSVDTAQVLVHVGDYSTSVVVVDGGKLRSIRAIKTGAVPREEPPAPAAEVPDPLGREAEAEAEREGDAPAEAAPVDPVEVERRLAELRARLNRELGRTVAGAQTAHPVETIYVCGVPVPGLVGSEIMEVPVEQLEFFPGGAEGGSPPVVAFGTAWRQLGGGMLQPALRREELRYAGKLERLELPLAVLGLLVVTLLAVKFIVVTKQINWRDEGNLEIAAQGDLQVWLEASNNYLEVNLPDMPDELRQYMETAEAGGDTQRTKYQELRRIKSMIEGEIARIRKVLGQDADVTKPQSALQAATLVLGLFDELDDRVGRYSLRRFSSTFLPGRRGGRSDQVQIKMDLTFFAPGDPVQATANYTAYKNALASQPWCIEVPDEGSENLDDGNGIFVDGFTCYVDMTRFPED